MGQPLFSAVLERPMRDLLRTLKSLAADDGNMSLIKHQLNLDAEDEMRCFKSWLDSLPSYQKSGLETTQNFGLGSLAASFLLGWWFGGG